MDEYDDPMALVDELMYLARNGVAFTADQEMAAQELGINTSELKEFAYVTQPFTAEAEAGEEADYDY